MYLCLLMFELIERWDRWRQRRAKARQKRSFIERTGGSQCCPYCNTWTWEVEGWAWVGPNPKDAALDDMTCKACGKTSTWLFGPGVFFLMHPKPEKEQ